MGFITNLLNGGIVGSIERIASEAIQTDMEDAEAKSLFIKTLDPNGMMRRQISNTVSVLYSLYIITMLTLIVLQFFGVGDSGGIAIAVDSIKELFAEITTAFIAIVGASFGVNGVNSYKEG